MVSTSLCFKGSIFRETKVVQVNSTVIGIPPRKVDLVKPSQTFQSELWKYFTLIEGDPLDEYNRFAFCMIMDEKNHLQNICKPISRSK